MGDEVPDLGTTVALPKPGLDVVLEALRRLGYRTMGPRVEDGAVVYGEIGRIDDLPRGWTSEQEAGRYRLVFAGGGRYFDATPGPHTWKSFFFPPKSRLLSIRRNGGGWKRDPDPAGPDRLALVGVRPCELEAIHVQDRVFLREEGPDPIYLARRRGAFILAVHCLAPCGTCFCASVGSGPRARQGFDLAVTELEEIFLVEVGSEVGRRALAGAGWEMASAFHLHAAQQGLERAGRRMGRALAAEGLPGRILARLEHPRWNEVGRRCLGCGSCTQVCPTCFCWDARDATSLDGRETRRDRVWDSCFNPAYSAQAGGNTRPTVTSRYRQWMAHKLGAWQEQFGTLGCVGCGRCITWCPVGIDITEEAAAIGGEALT